jgi:hypothetical protein
MSSFKLDDLLKIGSAALNTTAQTICEAINELRTTLYNISISANGTASATGVKKQRLSAHGTTYDIDGTKYMQQNKTLSTSDVTVATFTNSAITSSSLVDVYVSDWSIVPENVSVASGTCAVTLPQVDTAVTVTVRIYIR